MKEDKSILKMKERKNKRIDNQSGFTLIETAIVIVILSLVMLPLFSLIATQSKHDAMRAEEGMNERALAALSIYLKSNGAYPCPADVNLDVIACPSGPADISSGSLPVKELNLPLRAAVNSHGWRYLYTVTGALTNPATFNGTGLIDIVDATPVVIASNMHFVIVNPGYDGKGSSRLDGSAGPACGVIALDSENCDIDNDRFLETDASQLRGNSNDANYYDDVISYTLAREESTFWMAREDAGGGGGLSITSRNAGNIGVGTNAPIEKIHVDSGNILVQSGQVTAQQDITATAGDITATAGNIEATAGNITAGASITAGTNIEATAGNIEATAGNIEATAGSVEAGTRVSAPVFFYAP